MSKTQVMTSTMSNSKSQYESKSKSKSESNNGNMEDLAVVKEILRGRKDQFSILFNKYYKFLYYRIFRYLNTYSERTELAQDLTMISMEKALSNIKKFEAKKGFTFNAWITTLSYNTFVDFTRKRGLTTVSIDVFFNAEEDDNDSNKGMSFDVHSNDNNPHDCLERNERICVVQNAIKNIDSLSKELIRLRFYEEKKYEEIAEELQLPLGSVKAGIFNAKKLLRGKLRGYISA